MSELTKEEVNEYVESRKRTGSGSTVYMVILLVVFVFLWVKIYKQPIPPFIARIFGMDDPQTEDL